MPWPMLLPGQKLLLSHLFPYLKGTQVSLFLNANPQLGSSFRIAKVMASAVQVNVAASCVQGN